MSDQGRASARRSYTRLGHMQALIEVFAVIQLKAQVEESGVEVARLFSNWAVSAAARDSRSARPAGHGSSRSRPRRASRRRRAARRRARRADPSHADDRDPDRGGDVGDLPRAIVRTAGPESPPSRPPSHGPPSGVERAALSVLISEIASAPLCSAAIAIAAGSATFGRQLDDQRLRGQGRSASSSPRGPPVAPRRSGPNGRLGRRR